MEPVFLVYAGLAFVFGTGAYIWYRIHANAKQHTALAVKWQAEQEEAEQKRWETNTLYTILDCPNVILRTDKAVTLALESVIKVSRGPRGAIDVELVPPTGQSVAIRKDSPADTPDELVARTLDKLNYWLYEMPDSELAGTILLEKSVATLLKERA